MGETYGPHAALGPQAKVAALGCFRLVAKDMSKDLKNSHIAKSRFPSLLSRHVSPGVHKFYMYNFLNVSPDSVSSICDVFFACKALHDHRPLRSPVNGFGALQSCMAPGSLPSSMVSMHSYDITWHPVIYYS